MIDPDNIEYTITKWDLDRKDVTVTFSEGGWAVISLNAPFPSTLEELDTVVKRFATPVEIIQARAEVVDLTFIEKNVGKKEKTSRYLRSQVSEVEAASTSAVTPAEEIAAMEERRLRKFVESILAEKGL